jgi:hypothetical protein
LFYTYDTITPLICCFFLLPTTMITTATITSTTTIIVHTLHKQIKNNISGNTVPILFVSNYAIIWLFCYCANALAVSFLFLVVISTVALSILSLVWCMFCIYTQIFVHVCFDCLFILSSINQIVIYDGVWSYTRHHRRQHTTPRFFYGVVLLPATPTSSFVSPTPQFCDKELHPFFFYLFTCLHTDLAAVLEIR